MLMQQLSVDMFCMHAFCVYDISVTANLTKEGV